MRLAIASPVDGIGGRYSHFRDLAAGLPDLVDAVQRAEVKLWDRVDVLCRRGYADDVAELLGCSRSSLYRHLRAWRREIGRW